MKDEVGCYVLQQVKANRRCTAWPTRSPCSLCVRHRLDLTLEKCRQWSSETYVERQVETACSNRPRSEILCTKSQLS